MRRVLSLEPVMRWVGVKAMVYIQSVWEREEWDGGGKNDGFRGRVDIVTVGKGNQGAVGEEQESGSGIRQSEYTSC
jgi:hypothetical protein